MGVLTLDTVVLNPRMAWVDEFSESEVLSNTQHALDGSLIVQYGMRKGGVPMTLKGGATTRFTLSALHTLQKLMKVCILTMQDGREFNVVFDGHKAIVPTPIGQYHDTSIDLYYELELHLVQIKI